MEKLNTYEGIANKQHFFAGLAKAIDQIHSKSIYHGDLQLQNIGYINNIVKIFDFGKCNAKDETTDINWFNKLYNMYNVIDITKDINKYNKLDNKYID